MRQKTLSGRPFITIRLQRYGVLTSQGRTRRGYLFTDVVYVPSFNKRWDKDILWKAIDSIRGQWCGLFTSQNRTRQRVGARFDPFFQTFQAECMKAWQGFRIGDDLFTDGTTGQIFWRWMCRSHLWKEKKSVTWVFIFCGFLFLSKFFERGALKSPFCK